MKDTFFLNLVDPNNFISCMYRFTRVSCSSRELYHWLFAITLRQLVLFPTHFESSSLHALLWTFLRSTNFKVAHNIIDRIIQTNNRFSQILKYSLLIDDFSDQEEYEVVSPHQADIAPHSPGLYDSRQPLISPDTGRRPYRHQTFPPVRLYRLVSLYLMVVFVSLEVGVYILTDLYCSMKSEMCQRIAVTSCVVLTITALIISSIWECKMRRNRRQIIMDFVTKGEA